MNSRLRLALKKILKSRTILKNIFKYLPEDEQIKLASIHRRFRYIVYCLLWKNKYQQLKIYKTPYTNIISNEVDMEFECGANASRATIELIRESKVAMTANEMKLFLIVNCKEIRTLQIISECRDLQGMYLGAAFKQINIFENLLHLSYQQMIIKDENLKLLAKTCKNLQVLQIRECCSEFEQPIVPGITINLSNIIAMQNLKELVIINASALVTNAVPYIYATALEEILQKMQLHTLILQNLIVFEENLNKDVLKHLPALSNIRTLNIGAISSSFWPKCKLYLTKFTNLMSLTINVDNCNTQMSKNIFDVLCNRCKRLKVLKLENCDLQMSEFKLPRALKSLTLNACGGLTFQHLKDILSNMQLKSFALRQTRLYDIAEESIFISPSLESIVIDTIRFSEISNVFEKSLNGFENLKSLRWLNGDIHEDWIINRCPRLEMLHIPNPYLLRKVVFKLKSLRELTFTSCEGLSWQLLWIVLKDLPNLRKLYVKTSQKIKNGRILLPAEARVTTSVELLYLPYAIFRNIQPFCLSLLQNNSRLKFIVFGTHDELLHKDFLYHLINNTEFPKSLSAIRICGFRIDCRNIICNFDAVVHDINRVTSHFRSKKSQFTLEI